MIDFFTTHQFIFGAICSFISKYVLDAFAGSLPAPTDKSSPYYVFTFKFANRFAANLERARNARPEASPNFQDAIDKQLALAGHEPIKVQAVANIS